MIKVLQITGQLARNGTETFIMNVFRNINRQKIMFDFLLFTQAIENGYYQEAESLGAKIYRLPERKSGVVKYWRALDRFFKEHAREYDAVHFNGNSFTSVTAVYYAKKYKIPIRIVHSHNSSTRGFHNKILHKLNKLFIHKIATDYLACSDRAAIWAYGNTSVLAKSKIINNGINLDEYHYNECLRGQVRREMEIEKEFVIGNVGRLTNVKNHVYLIDVFAKIKEIRKNSLLLIVGEGELRDFLHEKVKALGLDGSIKFLGIREDISKIMQAMDVFVMPSLYEGLPFVLIEAQAAGLPCFVSDTISRKVALTPSLKFLDITSRPEVWAEAIVADSRVSREVISNSELLKNYSIKNTCIVLDEIYSQNTAN